MRYDSGAQTLLNHRPLTIFTGSVPFGKVRNNEINKHSPPLVTAPAPRALDAARLLMRGGVPLRSGGEEKRGRATKRTDPARLAANQLPGTAAFLSCDRKRFLAPVGGVAFVRPGSEAFGPDVCEIGLSGAIEARG